MSRTLISLAAVACSAPFASAAILGVTGNTTLLGSPPPSCLWTALQGQTAFAWNERTGVNLFLNVDMINNPGNSTSATPGSVGGGPMDTHFLHFDGVPGVVGVVGTVTFDAPIAAVIFRNTTLDASDASAGALTTLYPTLYPFRGLSSVPPAFFSISGNTLSFNFQSITPHNFVDQVRIITHTVPAPGAAALLGLAGIACARRRRS